MPTIIHLKQCPYPPPPPSNQPRAAYTIFEISVIHLNSLFIFTRPITTVLIIPKIDGYREGGGTRTPSDGIQTLPEGFSSFTTLNRFSPTFLARTKTPNAPRAIRKYPPMISTRQYSFYLTPVISYLLFLFPMHLRYVYFSYIVFNGFLRSF